MSLSNKLRADYIELINQQLDNIQIISLDDFEIAQHALQHIVQPQEGYSFPEKYQEKMFSINDYLQSPEDYVEHKQNYSEYQQIIRARIVAKINELQSLNDTSFALSHLTLDEFNKLDSVLSGTLQSKGVSKENYKEISFTGDEIEQLKQLHPGYPLVETQKRTYIQNQQTQKAQTATNQETMAKHQPPQAGSYKHVQTEAQWLAERQEQFNRELRGPNQTQGTDGVWQRRRANMLNDLVYASNNVVDETDTTMLDNSMRYIYIDEVQQPAISPEQAQRLVDSFNLYLNEFNSAPGNFFTEMQSNHNFSWFDTGVLQNQSPPPQERIAQVDLDAIRALDTARQNDLREHQNALALQTGQRNLIEQGQAVGLSESQLHAIGMYVLDKLSVVRAIYDRIFSMLDFIDLTTEQIANVGTIALVEPNCVTALSDQRTTIAQLADMDAYSLRQAVESDDYPRPQLR